MYAHRDRCSASDFRKQCVCTGLRLSPTFTFTCLAVGGCTILIGSGARTRPGGAGLCRAMWVGQGCVGGAGLCGRAGLSAGQGNLAGLSVGWGCRWGVTELPARRSTNKGSPDVLTCRREVSSRTTMHASERTGPEGVMMPFAAPWESGSESVQERREQVGTGWYTEVGRSPSHFGGHGV